MRDIIEFIKGNQALIAGLGLGSAGMITFFLRNIPIRIFNIIKRELTTDLILTSHHSSFHQMLEWIETNFKNKNFRTLKLTNGIWGSDEKTITSMGYGKHLIKYRGKFLMISLTKETETHSDRDKETITLTKLGRSRKLFDELIEEIKSKKDDSKIKIYQMTQGWEFLKEENKRSIDTIFIESNKKNYLIERLEKFINEEDWYLKNGVPYQLGILFHGPPGTGKTSLIKALASYLDYPIYYLPPKKLAYIEDAMAYLPQKSIVVIEDIDTNSLTHTRTQPNLNNPLIASTDRFMDSFQSVSLSEVLNATDGVFSSYGRILIATTNHVEKLDPALTRPGRIDIKIEIGYVNNEIFMEFINNFFPNHDLKDSDLNSLVLKEKITVATLQSMVLEGKNEKEIFELVRAT